MVVVRFFGQSLRRLGGLSDSLEVIGGVDCDATGGEIVVELSFADSETGRSDYV